MPFYLIILLFTYLMQLLFNDLFDNQIQFGEKIVNAFNKSHIHSVLAFAHTQCGKTGAILATIHLSKIHSNNIFIITGLSSVDWINQTKNRIPISNIFHRNTLHNFIQKLSYSSNPLVFIDECHIASKPGQAIHNILPLLRKFNAKTVFVSATPNLDFFKPDGVLKHGFAIRVMLDPPNYVSIPSILNHTFQCKNISDHPDALTHIQEIIPFIGSVPAYHIIRTPRHELHRITINNFKSLFPDFILLSMPENIHSILSVKPTVHTFIFIKDTLRCAITIPKTFIGILYERFSFKPNPSSVIQGLAGRATGFYNNKIVVFSFPDILSTV